VVLEPREVEVFEARLLAAGTDQAEFEILCGKGTYVRSWVRDMALALGTLGHVSALRRTRVGGFSAEDAITLDKLRGFVHIPAAFEHLRPISTALDGIPALAVTDPDALRLRNGNPIVIRATQFAQLAEGTGPDEDLQGLTVFLSTREGEPVALAELAEGELRPFRVFNFATG
jgi:tRNA pseudouridine55 synthase